MNHLQLPIPEYRRKGFSLLAHACALYFKNIVPILFLTAIITIPVEAIKNYYYFEPEDGFIYMPMSSMDSVTSLFFLCVITPMIIYYILGIMTGNSSGIVQPILWGLRKWPRMIVYTFLHGVIVVAGFIVFIVPGFLFAVWLMLMPSIVSIADTSRINPMTVSRDLARGRYFKFVGYAIGGYVMVLVLTSIIVFIFSLYVNQSWITATIFDLCYSLFNQLVTIVLLLVFLQVYTERNDDALNAMNEAV
ncbi:YciC family protein [Paenibacillus sp. MCAF9]|uniref:YciC family protein n=1 Tax=Paenibacillus sp. MCAF9 TaxID=3233046 RepID=UPI003F952A4F